MAPSKFRFFCAAVSLLAGASMAQGQSGPALRLLNTILLPGVEGRIDHLTIDLDTQRLFVAALGNNTVEVVDIRSAKRVHSITGLAEPQGVLYHPDKKRLFVANAKDGTIRIFDAVAFRPVRSVNLGDDADNVRIDPAAQRIYVGYGSGALAALDADGNKVADIKLDAHPESFQLEKAGPRIFVNLPDSKKVAVIDRKKGAVIANWTTDDASANFPMALDEANGRLFIICRRPARMLVLDTKSGAIIAKLPAVGDCDDVFYDQNHKRIYASGGEGAIAVYRQQDAGHYSEMTRIQTAKGARTSLFVPELNRLFVAVRRHGNDAAAIRIYEALP